MENEDEFGKVAGIIPYVLSERLPKDERSLSLRQFTENQKLRAYERQGGICPLCGKHYEYSEMQGDHKIPWSQGGKTTDDNLQMLCRQCNLDKSDK